MGLCGSTSGAGTDADDVNDGSVPVDVNVYDLQRRPTAGPSGGAFNATMGLGAYHSGVVVFGQEFSFGGDPNAPPGAIVSGIFSTPPKSVLPAPMFWKQHRIGRLPAGTTLQQVLALVERMKPEWPVQSYHLVRRNCNHFSAAFLEALEEEFIIEPVKRVIAEDKASGRAKEKGYRPPRVPSRTFELPAYVNRAAKFSSFIAPAAVIRALGGAHGPERVPNGAASPKTAKRPATAPGGSSSSSSPPPAGHSSPSAAPSATANTSDAKLQHPLPNDRARLETMSVRELKTAMFVHNVDWSACVEKSELVDAVLRHYSGADRDQR